MFDEPLDSAVAATPARYLIDNGIGIPLSAIPSSPLFSIVTLRLQAKLHSDIVYHLSVNNIPDCSGNLVGTMNTVKTGLAQPADSFDIVFNELLFNPASGGYDYIELYNRSNKIVNLKELYLAGRDITGTLNNIKQVDTSFFLFFPGEYLAFTENINWLQQNYLVKDPLAIREINSLPPMPDDKGTIVLTSFQGRVTDVLHYDATWHFALLNNEEGVALERINYNQPGQDKNNWTSASSVSGFGTPGYQNSQFRADLRATGQLTVFPEIFSPDNDGIDDLATIRYLVTGPGYVASIIIFDAQGRPVRNLVRNALLGITGDFRWDGLDDNFRKLPIGIYIVFTEIFNLQGKTKKFKNAITLARRF